MVQYYIRKDSVGMEQKMIEEEKQENVQRYIPFPLLGKLVWSWGLPTFWGRRVTKRHWLAVKRKGRDTWTRLPGQRASWKFINGQLSKFTSKKTSQWWNIFFRVSSWFKYALTGRKDNWSSDKWSFGQLVFWTTRLLDSETSIQKTSCQKTSCLRG